MKALGILTVIAISMNAVIALPVHAAQSYRPKAAAPVFIKRQTSKIGRHQANPKKKGIGEVWVNTQFERTAAKNRSGAATFNGVRSNKSLR